MPDDKLIFMVSSYTFNQIQITLTESTEEETIVTMTSQISESGQSAEIRIPMRRRSRYA